jgi:putative ABC transport system permease protein
MGLQMEPDAVVPMEFPLGSLGGGGSILVQVIGRLRPAVQIERAQAELAAIQGDSPRASKAAPAPVRVIPLHQRIVGNVRTPLLILWLVTGFVLLVACANIANLLLARSSSRASELAVCAALGAGRWRIMRALLTETLVLSFAGGAAGILLAWALVRAIVPLVPFEVPRLNDVAADWQIGAAAFGICALTGLVCGLLPAFAGSGIQPGHALKDRTGGSGGQRLSRIHSVLATGELALALLLLLGAGLCVQSLWIMSRASALFAPDRVLVADVDSGRRVFRPGAPDDLLDGLDAVAEALPGVTSAGVWKRLGSGPASPDSTERLEIVRATPHLLEASGVRLLAGRGFDPDLDTQVSDEGLGPAVVNQGYLRQYPGRFPDPGSAIGQLVEWGQLRREIVGVVSDFRPRPDVPGEPLVYLPLGGRLTGGAVGQLLVRTSGDAARVEAPLRAALAKAGVTATSIETLGDRMSAAIAPRTFLYALLGTFAAIALLLALIGIYGVLNFAVTERTQELGIRMALGATRGTVQKIVLARSAKIAGAGTVAGVAGALSLFRLVRNMVYGVAGLEFWLIAAISALLGVGVLLAAYLPARRAGNLDPLQAIRHE